jgi:hypothetical protein
MEHAGGLVCGNPNEKGLRILEAVGSELSAAERSDMIMLAEWGAPTTEKYWNVLLACLDVQSVETYNRALLPA